jgi:hypothetical protein
MYSRLDDDDKSFVSFIGIYSTPEHPFGLVFRFMDQLNLGGYLRKNRDTGVGLELVKFCRPICRFQFSHLFDGSY